MATYRVRLAIIRKFALFGIGVGVLAVAACVYYAEYVVAGILGGLIALNLVLMAVARRVTGRGHLYRVQRRGA